MLGNAGLRRAIFGKRPLWTPAKLGSTTCIMWYDAADRDTITLDASNNCTDLKDKSGNGKTASKGANTPPPYVPGAQNGNGVLTFAVAERLNFTSTATAAGFMIALVYKFVTADLALHYILAGSGQGIATGGNSSWPDFLAYDGTNIRSSNGAQSLNSYNIHVLTPTKLYKNGTETGYLDTGTVGALTIAAIGDRTDTSLPFKGAFAEAVICNSSSTDDRQRLEGYLAWKWGLNFRLPTAHPYSAIAPGQF